MTVDICPHCGEAITPEWPEGKQVATPPEIQRYGLMDKFDIAYGPAPGLPVLALVPMGHDTVYVLVAGMAIPIAVTSRTKLRLVPK